jgi:hypothetical protein
MSPKAKYVLARDHLNLAREEIEEGHLGIAATLLLHGHRCPCRAEWNRNQPDALAAG